MSNPIAQGDVHRQTLAEKNQPAIDLLDEWLADESGYDEETWPELAEALGLTGVQI